MAFSGAPQATGSPPPWLPAAAHARPAGGRARAAIGFRLRARSHLVEPWLARAFALRAFAAGAVRRDLVVERDAHLVEIGLVDTALPLTRLSAPRFGTLSRFTGRGKRRA